MQIRTRLTLQFITIVAGILLLALGFIYLKFWQMSVDEFLVSLRSKALMTAEMVLHDESKIKPLEANQSNAGGEYSLPFKENILIYNNNLQQIFAFDRSAKPVSENVLRALKDGQEYRFQRDDRYAIGLKHQSRSGQSYLIVAESVFHPDELGNLQRILVITFLLGIGIVALGGWFFAGQAMAPVARIVDQVGKILPSDLSARLKTSNNHDELSRLVVTFNRLLDRIQFAFRMQKSFISNVSHEMKNPLSVIISQLEVSLGKKRAEEEYRATLQSVLEDTRELADVADKLLQLARVHSEQPNIVFERIRLDELMLQSRESLLRLHPDYHIAFDIAGMPESEEELCILGNEPLLRSAILNLMDNGCKFSPDKHVDVRILFDGAGNHSLEIADRGPGIPERDLQLIFQPFYRSSQNTRVRGSGIGLSLVDSILKLHRVGLKVASKPGEGTTFRLDFPAVAAA
ncbi:MAG: HAMP domain-containing protein [Saprospiraceae bacterium]|nr:HAMP domain-containing protein [Saprospiraceae bacterium]